MARAAGRRGGETRRSWPRVRAALDAGLARVRPSEHFMGSALLPQPLPEVLQAFAHGD